jgi:hypothetical protein
MLSSFAPLWPDLLARARALARADARRRPERRLLGRLALAMQHDDDALIDSVVDEALAWPEADVRQCARKATLLYAITGMLTRARYVTVALRVAPLIPQAEGMTQVLVFSTDQPPQRFCWRVTPAYALVQGRTPSSLPVEPLVQPYRRGRVHIDHAYLRRVLLPRRRRPRPILLLPHPLGMVELDGVPYVILDGNHRVVCAWYQRRRRIPGFVLTRQEAAAVLVSHSQWPPYQSNRTTQATEASGGTEIKTRPLCSL